MKDFSIINEMKRVKEIVFEHDNLLEGLVPEVRTPEGTIPKIDRHCKPAPEEIKIITQRKQLYYHIDIFGNGNTLTYDMKEAVEFRCFVVSTLASHFVGEMELYVSDDKDMLYTDENKIAYCKNEVDAHAKAIGGMIAIEFPLKKAQYLGIKILKGSVLDDIFRPNYLMLCDNACIGGIKEKNYELQVETKKVINPKFYGTGGAVIPMHLMPENVQLGYGESHFALEAAALKRLKVNVVRLWFQVDWITDNYEDYKNGIYTFRSPKFETVCRFLQVLKEAGSNILLDFGWKTAAPVNEWFGFDHFLQKNHENRWASAPRELDLFAKACAGTLQELMVTRGFDNIKYLTFYNEPKPVGDFQTPFGTVDDMQEAFRLNAKWWRKMADTVDEELKNCGLRDSISMWGPEFAPERGDNGHIPYFRWLEEEEGCPLEVMTYHQYNFHSFEVREQLENLRHYTDKPLVLGECGSHNGAMYWDNSNAQTFIDIANAGYSGMNFWVCTGPCRFTAPIRLKGVGSVESIVDGGFGLIRVYCGKGGRSLVDFIQPVGYMYPLYAMFNHYIPVCSKVLQTGDDYEGLRYAAFETSTGDYTVVVEIKNSVAGGHFTLKFDKCLNRTFYIHKDCRDKHYVIKHADSINGVIPPCCGEIKVDDTLEFDFDGQYGVYCFTTKQSVPQVTIDKEKVLLKRNESTKLHATLVDATGDIEWSVVAGEGSVDADGTVTMPFNSIKDDMFAVEARIKNTDTYAVAVICCE